MLTPLLAQCDSAISVCPPVFDYLISQDVKEQKCRQENINLKASIVNLEFQVKKSADLLKSTSDILLITNEEKQLMQVSIDLKDKQLKKQTRQITGLKIGCVAIGIAGIISTTYFIFH